MKTDNVDPIIIIIDPILLELSYINQFNPLQIGDVTISGENKISHKLQFKHSFP